MIQHVPGVLMYTFYGASDETACLLVQHYNLYMHFCTQGANLNMGVFEGLCYLAARLNMPQLIGHLLSWGVNIWAQRTGYRPEAWLNMLYSVASGGTRHLISWSDERIEWFDFSFDRRYLKKDSHKSSSIQLEMRNP